MLGGTRLGASAFLSNMERRALEDAMFGSKTVRAGVDLVQEGQSTDWLIVIVRGWACRIKTTREGDRQVVALLVPGDVANLDSLLLETPNYGVRSLTEVTTVSLRRGQALALAAEHPGIARTFTWLAMVENAILSQWALCLGRLSATQRLAHLFCELSIRTGDQPGNNGGFEVPMTQETLGDVLGLTAVHINRTMQRLRADGLIVTNGRSFTIPDAAALGRIGDFTPAYLNREPKGDSLLTESGAG